MKALHKNNETTGCKGCTLSKFQVLRSPPRINIHSLHKTIPLHCHHHWLTDQQSLEVQNSVLPEVKMLPYSITQSMLYACKYLYMLTHACMQAHTHALTDTHTHTHTHLYTCMHTPFTQTRSYLRSMTSCLWRHTRSTTALGSHL